MAEGTVSFSVPGRAVPQGSLSPFLHAKTGRIVTPQKPALLAWRRVVGMCGIGAGVKITDGPCAVTITARYARPKSHILKSGELSARAPRHRTSTPDVDKIARAILDALTGIAWYSDAQVVALQAFKLWSAEDRVDIAIGLLDTEEAAA